MRACMELSLPPRPRERHHGPNMIFSCYMELQAGSVPPAFSPWNDPNKARLWTPTTLQLFKSLTDTTLSTHTCFAYNLLAIKIAKVIKMTRCKKPTYTFMLLA